MKFSFKILFLFLLLSDINYAQSLYWQRIYGLNQQKEGLSGTESFDGGFLIGSKWLPASGRNEMNLVKTDKYGTIQWEKNYFVNNPIRIIQLSDSNYISVGGGRYGAGIFKISKNGDSIWYKEFGNNSNAYFNSVKLNFDGKYIACGNKPISSFFSDVYMVKIDSSSNLIWEKLIGNTKYHHFFGNDFLIEKNKNIIVTGTAYTEAYPLIEDTFLFKLHSEGNLYSQIFLKTDSLLDGGERILKSYDNEYIISGFGTDLTAPAPSTCARFMKVDTTGNLVVSKNYFNCTNLIEKTIDGNYMMGGYIQSGKTGRVVQFGLRKIDQEGNEIWLKTLYGCYSKTYPNDFEITSDGGYFMVGYFRDTTFQFESNSIYVAKTNSEGCVNFPLGILNNTANISDIFRLYPSYPNPFNNSTTIKYIINKSGFLDLSVYSIKGEMKKKIENKFKVRGSYSVNINLDGLSSGIYFIRLSFLESSEIQKIVFLK